MMNKKLIIGGFACLFLMIFIITLSFRPQPEKTEQVNNLTPTLIPSLAAVQKLEPQSAPPVGAYEESLKQYKTEEPDFYLAQFISSLDPYTALSFSIEKEFKTTPTNHFGYVITLKGTDKVQARRDAVDWLRSKGLTDAQILKLDLTYKNE